MVGRRAAVLVVIAGLSIGACDGSSECSNGCWQPTPAEQSFISSFCALSLACCASNGLPNATNETSCLSGFQRSGVSADSSLQAACLSEMQARAGATLCQPDGSDLSDPCLRTLNEPSGPQQPGSQCMNRDDCAGVPGTVTKCLPFNGNGVCVQMAPGEYGDHTCLGDLLPDGISTLNFAFHDGAVVVPRGVFCARGDGLYCAQTQDPTTSVCAPLVADGAPCLSEAACGSGTCESSLSARGTCAQKVSAGASCLGDAVCDDASYCAESAASTWVCLARESTGSPCTASMSIQCASGNCGPDNFCSAVTGLELAWLQSFCFGAF